MKFNFFKAFLCLAVLFILVGCSTDNRDGDSQDTFIMEILSTEAAIEEISLFMRSNSKEARSDGLALLKQVNHLMSVKKLKEKSGFTAYTFSLRTDAAKSKSAIKEQYFDNLFVNIDSLGSTRAQLVRYVPDSEWLAGSRDIEYYSGEIQILSNEEEIMGSMILFDGLLDVSKED